MPRLDQLIAAIITLFSSQGDRRQSQRRIRELIGSNRRQRERRVDWKLVASSYFTHIQQITSGEIQVANDDTEGMKIIDRICDDALAKFSQMEAERQKKP